MAIVIRLALKKEKRAISRRVKTIYGAIKKEALNLCIKPIKSKEIDQKR